MAHQHGLRCIEVDHIARDAAPVSWLPVGCLPVRHEVGEYARVRGTGARAACVEGGQGGLHPRCAVDGVNPVRQHRAVDERRAWRGAGEGRSEVIDQRAQVGLQVVAVTDEGRKERSIEGSEEETKERKSVQCISSLHLCNTHTHTHTHTHSLAPVVHSSITFTIALHSPVNYSPTVYTLM